MISHALTIVANELQAHLTAAYGMAANQVQLANMAEGFVTGAQGVVRERLVLNMVNIKEEKSLKNVPHYVRNDVQLKASFENPPVFANFIILVTATHASYANALLMISRAIRFFQSKNVFTQENVPPANIVLNQPSVPDRLEAFKMIFDLYSPNMEEVNHMWGTLGGKQYPFVLYMMRMLDLKFQAVQEESGLITEVVSEFYHKQ
jgi:hypothetical protein